jgi:hypothetical protein
MVEQGGGAVTIDCSSDPLEQRMFVSILSRQRSDLFVVLIRGRRPAVALITRWWLAVAVAAVLAAPSHAQQSSPEPAPPGEEHTATAGPSEPNGKVEPPRPSDDVELEDRKASDEQIEIWIESLGSRDFAIRERAASELMSLGGTVLSRLQKVASDHDDPEVRIRAAEIVKQLTRGDLKVRIDAFLAGEDVNFKGWTITQAIMGDSGRVRELFVQMLQSHPDLAASMEGTPRDRAMALKNVVAAVESKMFQQRQFPDAADLIALLLPTVDMNVPLEGGYEEILIAVLQKSAATSLQQDPQLSGPFRALLGRWIPRCSIKNCDEMLFYGMSWEMRQTHLLAQRTLSEARQSEALVYALQAIAQFGDEHDVERVAKFLGDKRPAAEPGFANGKSLKTEIGDVAMATIARLHDVPLKKIGFPKESLDEKFAFQPGDLGFPVDDELARARARKKILDLIDPDSGEGL